MLSLVLFLLGAVAGYGGAIMVHSRALAHYEAYMEACAELRDVLNYEDEEEEE